MNKTNLVIDISILTAFLVAMEPRFTGVTVHEWLALALAGTVIAHLLLHWEWMVNVAGRFFADLWHTSRLKFVVDTLLFVAFTGIMISGVMISRSVLPALGLQAAESPVWRMLHSTSANAGMLLVALHFALNWMWVLGMTRRYLFAPLVGLFKPAPKTEVTREAAGD